MKTVIKGALALVLLASTAQAAFAQDDGGEHRRGNRQDGDYNPAMRASSRNVPPSLQERPPQAQAPQQAPQAPQPQSQAQPQGPSQNGQGGRRNDSNWQSRQPAQPGQQGQQPSQPRWNNGQGQNNNQGRGREDRPDRNDRNQGWNNGQGQSWQGRDNDPRRDGHHDRNDRNPDWNNNGSNGWNNNGRDWRPDRNQQQRPQFDRRHYGQNFRSQQRYRGYAYRPPSGFYIRSWGYGDQLPRSWWSNQYRLNDWWSYGLPIPPIGYEYVRVGEDVLLVDMFSGRVVQVIRDVFW